MKHKSLTNLMLGMALCMPFLMSAQAAPVISIENARASRFASVPGEIIVKFKSSSNVSIKAPSRTKFRASSVNAVDKIFAEIGVNDVEQLMPLTGSASLPRLAKSYNGKEVSAPAMDKVYRVSLDTESGLSVYEAIKELKELDEVEFAEPNFIVHTLATDYSNPNDPYYSMQYGIADLNLPQLWSKPLLSDESPIIAILDTGVDIEHPDLQANIWVNEKEATGSTDYDDDRNGYVDDLNGWDFVNNTGRIGDYNGHGTHCAGIAAACGNNGLGIIGANPDAKIMPLTVMQSTGQGDVATIIKALDYASANGANVISMSIGTYGESIAFEQALGRAYQNAVIVAAAGNDEYCLNHEHKNKGQTEPMPMFPAAYNFVLGVQASTSEGGLASFSNYDDDGGFFTEYSEDKLYNYEVTAPGVEVMSTYPGGAYKQLSGTSMATPMVAGAVSRLLQTKEYTSKEVLFGDLINSVTAKGNLDIAAAYAISDDNRQPSLSLVGYRLDDETEGDGDGVADAGETIRIYPKFRNSWGNARNIRYNIKLDELEDTNTIEFIDNGDAYLISGLSSYATVEAENPFIIRFAEDVVDGRKVKMVLTATCDNISQPLEQEIVFTIENGEEIGGVISGNVTLYPDKNYIVTNSLGVADGASLTIMPGTVINFKNCTRFYVSDKADFICEGEPDKMIVFRTAPLSDLGTIYFQFANKTIKYTSFEDFSDSQYTSGNFENCEFKDAMKIRSSQLFHEGTFLIKSNLYDCKTGQLGANGGSSCNIIGNYFSYTWGYSGVDFNDYSNSNIFSNVGYDGNLYSGGYKTEDVKVYLPEQPNYHGSGVESIVRPMIRDILYSGCNSSGKYDLSNMLTRPVHDAHGIVWKVVVNGYDAQDEFDMLPSLGVGKHKFEVYFNRQMNHDVEPFIAMGVRSPYTQTSIAEDGEWRTETFDGEQVDIYTAYLTINGRSDYDGLNRIYVADAQDDEYFEIPVENVRFNVNVQAAGSLSEGFLAEAGLGRVNLSWDNSEENFDDMLGYNMYRYSLDNEGIASDTICINTRLIEADQTSLTDYDVVPGTTYCYYYKVMRTNMSENSPSKTVAVTPMTSIAGDANGSAKVDVADVITTVNYASGLKPEPFIFEAADVNGDEQINILDVVGIIRIILNATSSMSVNMDSEATFFVDNGLLYIDTPVELSGLQLGLNLPKDSKVNATETLDGFEQTGAWLSDDEYIFLAYSLTGKTVPTGVHPILNIGDAKIYDVTLSDVQGRNVETRAGATSNIADPMADWNVDQKVKGIYDIMGVKLADDAKDLDKLPKGIYIVNGCKIVK